MKSIVKIVVISMGMLFVGCGEAGANGPIYVSFFTMGTNTLDVEGANTECVPLVGMCALASTETVTWQGETLPQYMESNGTLEYTYTHDTYDANGAVADDADTADIDESQTSVSGSFSITANAGGDASGFDDGAAGQPRVCSVMITCTMGVCADMMMCMNPDETGAETCMVVEGVQVCEEGMIY